ncbi:hypothetical protein R6Q59_002696 [Mikania micrantha]
MLIGDSYHNRRDDKDLIEEDSLEFDDGFGNIIVVDNLPIMTKEKFQKLKGVFQQINSQIEVIKHNGLYMFVEEDTANNFIECKTTQFWTYFCAVDSIVVVVISTLIWSPIL